MIDLKEILNLSSTNLTEIQFKKLSDSFRNKDIEIFTTIENVTINTIDIPKKEDVMFIINYIETDINIDPISINKGEDVRLIVHFTKKSFGIHFDFCHFDLVFIEKTTPLL